VTSKEKEWKRRIKKISELIGTFACLPFHPLIDLVLQWVPQLKRSGLNVLFLARRRLLFTERLNAGNWCEITREAFAELEVD
jgi:hypothetical protein